MPDDNRPMVRREWWIAMAIVFLALMALVFVMCDGQPDETALRPPPAMPTSYSRVVGHLVVEGGSAPPKSVPGRVTIQLTSAPGHSGAQTIFVHADGRFQFNVTPGAYELRGRSRRYTVHGHEGACWGPRPLQVGSSHTVKANVVCRTL
jgi:hypothetical protein